MEIKNIKGRGYTNMSTSVNKMIKRTEQFLDSSLTKFVNDVTPIIMDYYSYDELSSTTGIGDKTTLGPYSGATKYRLIKDYIGYGYIEERNTTMDKNEKEDLKLSSDVLSFLHLPNTIIPTTDDRLTLKIENNQIFYRVTGIDYVTLHNKSYIKVDYIKDDNTPEHPWTVEHMRKHRLISKELRFVQENIGTNYSPFLEDDVFIELQKLYEKREEINDIYMSFYYDDYTNMIRLLEENGSYGYSPLLYYFQMEFFPLKIYENNDLMLSNEAIEDKFTIVKWKTHPFRKFLNKKGDSCLKNITLFKYPYYHQQTDPYFKVNSYMNSMDQYNVYDITKNNDKKPTEVSPSEEISNILTKWYNNDITDIKKINEDLEFFDLEDVNMSDMLYVPLLLAVIDRIYDDLYTRQSVNRFY